MRTIRLFLLLLLFDALHIERLASCLWPEWPIGQRLSLEIYSLASVTNSAPFETAQLQAKVTFAVGDQLYIKCTLNTGHEWLYLRVCPEGADHTGECFRSAHKDALLTR